MSKILKLNDDNFHAEVYHHDGPTVVTFGWSGCGPCRTQAKFLELLAGEGVKVGKVDITESPDIATHFNINTVPTTVFIARGEPRIAYKGVLTLDGLRKELAEAVADGEKAPADHVHA